jgi:hypothetical protein
MHTPEFIKTILKYDANSGALTWKKRLPAQFSPGKKTAAHQCSSWNSKYAGKPAFASIGNHGYHTSTICGKRYLAHRVIWAIHHGAWPSKEVDHINHVRTDNRISNLRQVSRSENSRNLSRATNNPSGATGVYWYSPTSRWVVKLHLNRKMMHVGYFKSKSAAISARKRAEILNGFHPNHGRAY